MSAPRPQEDFDKVCETIATSNKGLRAACGELGMSTRTFFNWVEKSKENQQQYTRARDEQAEFLADEMIEIADDGSKDTIKVYKDGKEVDVENKEWINRSKLRVETRKWIASKLKPKKYGDKVDLTSDGEKIQPVTIEALSAIASKINENSQ